MLVVMNSAAAQARRHWLRSLLPDCGSCTMVQAQLWGHRSHPRMRAQPLRQRSHPRLRRRRLTLRRWRRTRKQLLAGAHTCGYRLLCQRNRLATKLGTTTLAIWCRHLPLRRIGRLLGNALSGQVEFIATWWPRCQLWARAAMGAAWPSRTN